MNKAPPQSQDDVACPACKAGYVLGKRCCGHFDPGDDCFGVGCCGNYEEFADVCWECGGHGRVTPARYMTLKIAMSLENPNDVPL